MAKQRVIVEVHLGIERHHVARCRHHQRIDLGHGRIEIDEGAIEPGDELDRRPHLLALEAQPEGQLAAMKRLHADGGVDGDFEDLLRGLGGDLLDLDPAFGGSHHGDARGGAVDQHAEVKFTGDVAAFLDIDAIDHLARGAGLMGDESHAQHVPGRGDGHLGRFDELDATALAPAAGVNLRLDDPDRAAEFGHRRLGFLGREDDGAPGNGDPVFSQQALGLVLVNVHLRLLACPADGMPVERTRVLSGQMGIASDTM